MQVAAADGTSAANALLGVTPSTKEGSVVLIPSRLIVDVAGAGSMSFGETLALPNKSAPSAALTDLVGVNVDNQWVLTKGGLAALVDKVGGVRLVVRHDLAQ